MHGRCADGFTSAGLLLRKWPQGMVLYAQPGELLGHLRSAALNPPGKRLVIADLSAQLPDQDEIVQLLEGIAARCDVTWLDHHAPQWSVDFEKRLRSVGVDIVVDLTKTESGASLVAAWTRTRDPELLRVADLVRRRDAWVEPWNPQARAWVAVAGRRRREYVDRLAAGELDGLEAEGLEAVKEKDERIEGILARRVRAHSPGVHWQWGQGDVSDVADRLFQRDPVAALYLRFGRWGNVSIRSRQDRPVAALLAQRFGGGGHGNSAGCTIEMGFWRRLVYRLLRGRDRRAEEVRRAAQEVLAAASVASPPPKDDSERIHTTERRGRR